jgi:hypothetical protein
LYNSQLFTRRFDIRLSLRHSPYPSGRRRTVESFEVPRAELVSSEICGVYPIRTRSEDRT